ncbi:TonB-dependent receptor [Pelagibacteraceae bacterium]|nr:TonB-dependent receptor [Pelagibacteraceae bacterium]
MTLNPVFAADIPIIVIAPSQKAQSKSTVGTSVTVFDETKIGKSNDFFLGDILGDDTPSFNSFQTGGHGSASGIQLRGLPKRYSTVFIDGVKQSDPSSVSNDFDFSHILKNQISRVEILHGNQTSVYGGGAIGGTINIITKKGKPGFQKDISYNTASNKTHNLALSMSGANDKNDFYIGLERFITAGISAMNTNDENDDYRNNSLVANYGYKFNDKLKLENSIRYTDGYLQYDTTGNVTHVRKDSDEQHQNELSGSVSFIYEPNEQLTNRLTYSKYDIERTYNTYKHAQDYYGGYRNALNYFGNYNIDLDSSIVFGVDAEFEELDFNKGNLTTLRKEGFQTNSFYVDYQKRLNNNLYATLGGRLEEHSLSGKENSQRATLAYLFDDKLTKLKGSLGTGFKFVSLYEAYYVWGANTAIRSGLKAETSRGFDVGFEKQFPDLGLNIDLTYFNTAYYDALEGWSDNDNGNSATMNTDSSTRSQGLEFISKWNANEKLNFDFNYTYSSTFDGAEHKNPKLLASYTNSQMVRVPRHLFNLSTNYIFPDENLNLTLRTKVSSKARDYGSATQPADGSYDDVKLTDYMINDLSLNYNLWNSYNVFFDVNNILDKTYYTALQYGQLDRTINFGIKRTY